MKLLKKGHDAHIYEDNNKIVKIRKVKSYRNTELDTFIRKTRTRKESKILAKLNEIIPVPAVIDSDDINMSIRMTKILGKNLSEVFSLKLCNQIGKYTGLMHQQGIIHGSLTIHNMLISNETQSIYFIDFGLGYFSGKEEDRATDIYTFIKDIESRCFEKQNKAIELFLQAYKNTLEEGDNVIERLHKIKIRGRNKKMKGNM